MTILTATTLVTVGTFSGFCLAANSGEEVGQKIVKSDSSNKAPEQYKNNSNAKCSTLNEEQIKTELAKSLDEIIKEIEKLEQSESKNNVSGSSNGDKCIIVNDEQIRQELAKSHGEIAKKIN